MASRTSRIRTRTFTSQVSQFRSSEMECMRFVVSLSSFAVRGWPFAIRCSLIVVCRANRERRRANSVGFSIPTILRSSRTTACTEKSQCRRWRHRGYR
jgi:hypothetical protein